MLWFGRCSPGVFHPLKPDLTIGSPTWQINMFIHFFAMSNHEKMAK
jgi:hypothetical protein